jgi:hypothetical protein
LAAASAHFHFFFYSFGKLKLTLSALVCKLCVHQALGFVTRQVKTPQVAHPSAHSVDRACGMAPSHRRGQAIQYYRIAK